MSSESTPNLKPAIAERIVCEKYGIKAIATALPSERDQNFAMRSDSGEQYVLKIAKSDELLSVLELQNSTMRHVARHAPGVPLQQLISTLEGADLFTVTDHVDRTFFVRLMSWIDGVPLVDEQHHVPPIMESLGTALAELDEALLDFAHPAMYRELPWNLVYAHRALDHLPLLSEAQRSLVTHFAAYWQKTPWNSLRRSLIHGDANDHNVLVGNSRVVGLLDFGDMVYSAIACEPAIAIAYAMLDKDDPFLSGAYLLRAYHRRFPLTPVEMAAVYPLATARLCMSVCYAAYNALAKPDDPYQQTTARPAWDLLSRLAETPFDEAEDQLGALIQ